MLFQYEAFLSLQSDALGTNDVSGTLYKLRVPEVNDIDFFDSKIYGHEVERETVEQKELDDYTNPSDYEDKTERLKNFDESVDLKEVTTDEEEFRAWDGVDEDWEEFNSKDDKKKK